ncbi:MAG TPA: TIGR00730 family Rossman fold protein [Chitinispirillaceae bacterium]|nr:TIGR00730 family Rossman fold protein [Chitinispirillaceae bacterium]
MKSICVYCGSSSGTDMIYRNTAIELGKTLASHNITLVYGGGRIGLMGELADSVLKNGGQVIGIIPRFLYEKEVAHTGLTRLEVVETMHQRKAAMINEADGFISMPGGFGTLDETFEVISWGQLQLHQKPCAFYNIQGYYDDLKKFIERAVKEGFVDKKFKQLFCFENNLLNIMDFFATYVHPFADKVLGCFNCTRRQSSS